MNETPYTAPQTFNDLAEEALVKMERADKKRSAVEELDREVELAERIPPGNLYPTPNHYADARRARIEARRNYYEAVDESSWARNSAQTAALALARHLDLRAGQYVRIAYPQAGPGAVLLVKRKGEYSATIKLEKGPTEQDHVDAINEDQTRSSEY